MENGQFTNDFPIKTSIVQWIFQPATFEKTGGYPVWTYRTPREWWFPFATFLRAFGTWSWWMYSAAQQTLRRWNMTAPNAWSEPWISYNGIYKKLVSSIIGIKKIGMYFLAKIRPFTSKDWRTQLPIQGLPSIIQCPVPSIGHLQTVINSKVSDVHRQMHVYIYIILIYHQTWKLWLWFWPHVHPNWWAGDKNIT